MTLLVSRLWSLPLALLAVILAGCPLSPPTVGGYPIVCMHSSDCQHGERCDLTYGICIGLPDGGIIGEDGGPRDGGPCTTDTCFSSIVLTPAATEAGGMAYAGANQPLSVLAQLNFLGTITSAPAPASLDLSVSGTGGDAGIFAMSWIDGGANGYLYAATWPTASAPDQPFTFVASLAVDGGLLSSDPVVVTVDNTPPTLGLSLGGLVDGGPPLLRDFQQTATLSADDQGGSGIATGSYVLSGTGVPSSSTATWPVSASGTAPVHGRDLLLDPGASGLAGTFALVATVKDQVGNQATTNLPVPVTRLKWKLQLASAKAIDSSPVLGRRGRIYVGGNDQALHAVNPDGTLLWAYLAGDRITATPAVHVLDATAGTEIVYAPSQDTNVHAVIGADGGLVTGWTMLNTQPGATLGNVPNALVNSAAISPAENSALVGDSAGHVYAMSLDLGLVSSTYPPPAGAGLGASSSFSISSSSGSLFSVAAGQDGLVYAFTNVTLTLYGSYPLTSSDVYDASKLGGPAPVGSSAWLGASPRGMHLLTNLLNPGAQTDTVLGPAGSYQPSLVVGQGGTFGSRADGNLVSLLDGGAVTTPLTTANLTAPPTVGADGNIYVATTDGKIASVKPDGSIAWEGSLTGAAINSAPMIDPCNQTLYVGSSDGFLFAVITDAAGLDPGPWPHFRHDYQGTGNASLVGAVDCANHL